MKYYACKVCGANCIGLAHDGDLYEKEVCSEKCQESLDTVKEKQAIRAAAQDALKQAGKS
jgi:hypothetical protein